MQCLSRLNIGFGAGMGRLQKRWGVRYTLVVLLHPLLQQPISQLHPCRRNPLSGVWPEMCPLLDAP